MKNLEGDGDPASFSVEEERAIGDEEDTACWNISLLIFYNIRYNIIYIWVSFCRAGKMAV